MAQTINYEKNSILLVDDEKANLMYLNHILGTDYTIYMARGAVEAIERANELSPDLILLDIIMPDIDGYEVLASLKESETTKDIPVIYITGLCDYEDEVKGLNLGAEDYITKPFHDVIVKLRVRNQIKIVNQMRIIERFSMIDQLTDIANRRSFDQQIYKEWRSAIRMKSALSLLMVDVDNFKNYNDTYGHQQGDIALRTIADVLKRNIFRPTDFVARWGGEEFAVLLPSTDLNNASAIAENLRSSIENSTIPEAPTTLTVSIGLNSQTPSQNDSLDVFISKADLALYTAKNGGRNRVCIVP
ncbi:MAG: diguanylate cyclase [Holophagaceae bacterium]|nr:diguanylate cyclase [Holophagaceae bacterium]